MKKLGLSFLLILCFTFLFCKPVNAASSIYYKTASIATFNKIEVSKSELNSAKSKAVKKGSSFKYSATISKAYEMHIYHFEAPSQGYYAFYTTGATDTLIKVYEHQNFLWWTTQYLDRGLNDDGSMADENRTNASLVLELSAGEDYYVCVRAYSTKTGTYQLNVEGNQDRMLRSVYKYSNWDCEKLSNGSIISGVYTTKKQYLSKEETILFYWSLDPACQDLVGYDLRYLYNAYNESIQKGIDTANFILGALMSFANVNPVYSVSAGALGSILSYTYSSSNNDAYSVMKKLHDSCGVCYDGVKWVSTSGLVIEEWFASSTIPATHYSFEGYNDEVLVGDSYQKGTWNK